MSKWSSPDNIRLCLKLTNVCSSPVFSWQANSNPTQICRAFTVLEHLKCKFHLLRTNHLYNQHVNTFYRYLFYGGTNKKTYTGCPRRKKPVILLCFCGISWAMLSGDSFEKLLLTGKIEEKRNRGSRWWRKRSCWRKQQNRKLWHNMHNRLGLILMWTQNVCPKCKLSDIFEQFWKIEISLKMVYMFFLKIENISPSAKCLWMRFLNFTFCPRFVCCTYIAMQSIKPVCIFFYGKEYNYFFTADGRAEVA